MTTRTEQIASTIKAEVQRILARGLNDPRVRGLISVTRVEVTTDLRDAMLYVSILPAEHEALTMHGLESAAGHIRSQVGRSIRIRRMPRIEFRVDSSLKKQAAIEQAIRTGRPLSESSDSFDEDDPATSNGGAEA